MLRAEGISVAYGGVRALKGVSLEVEAGTVTGLIGPNGAGKTTMFNVITGLQRPSGGRIRLGDTDITDLGPLRRARLGVGRTFQRLETFGSLSTRDAVLVALESRRGLAPRRERRALAERLLERVGLSALSEVSAEVLSTGNARRLELARALATEPKVLLLDEASSGLDTYEKQQFGELLSTTAANGVAVLLVEHDMDLVMRICEKIFVLDFGELLAHGDPEEIRRDRRVQRAYLGAKADTDRVSLARVAERPAARAPALELLEIDAGYERFAVLHGVTIKVPAASVFALLGPNGTGKTTTLRVASGRLEPGAGKVLVDGVSASERSAEKLARSGLCSIPEGRGIFPNLTVAEHLRMWTYRGGVSRDRLEEVAFTRFPILAERRKQLAGTLSGGEQQMLAMSRAVATDPKILLLDELSMGLAPRVVAQLYEIVAQIAADGIAILLVEQFAHTALSVADQAAVMIQGRVELTGPPDEVAAAAEDLYMRTSSI